MQLGYSGYTVATSDAPLRQKNGLQYDLPEMLPGLKAGVTLVYGSEENSASGGKTNGGQGFNISYASGPIYAGYTFDRVKNTGIGIFSSPSKTVKINDDGTLTSTSTSYDVADASSSDQNEFTTMSASYDIGVAKISINNSKMAVGSKSIGDKGHETYQLGVNYALSKRTVLYAQYGKMELKDTTKFEQTGSAFGVHHSF